jgi:hypothetical protein
MSWGGTDWPHTGQIVPTGTGYFASFFHCARREGKYLQTFEME